MFRKNAYLQLLKTAWKYAEGRRKAFVAFYVLSIIAHVVWMIRPYLFGKLINVIQAGGEKMIQNIILYLLLLLGTVLVGWTFHGVSRVIERLLAFRIFQRYQERFFYMLTRLPVSWHKDHHSGETINRIKKASQALRDFSDESFMIISPIVDMTVALVAMLLIFPAAIALMIFLGAVVVGIILGFDKLLIRLQEKINEKEHSLSSIFYDYVSNIYTIITLRLEALSRKEFLRKILAIFPFFRRNVVINEVKWFSMDILVSLLSAGVLFLYLMKYVGTAEGIMIGSFITLYQYMERFTGVFSSFAWKFQQLVMQNVDVHTADDIARSYRELVSEEGIFTKGFQWKMIKIDHWNFRYEDSKHKRHSLKDISLQLRRGQRIALVGESGSGKSTLLSLLRGLQRPAQGSLKVDGEMKDVSYLSAITTLIPQEPEIFENTIEYNITAGISHSQKEIFWACRLARFEHLLAKLPRGLKTHIQEKGVNLSGGEKQRLALARGLFSIKENSLILLDESTSSVDSINERSIYEAIFEAFPDKCIISSIHKLHLLPMFDYIYVLDHGVVVEEGKYEELLKKPGVLSKLVALYQKNEQA